MCKRLIPSAALLCPLLLVASAVAQPSSENWRLVETLRIGSIDGQDALSDVTALTVSPDGTKLYVKQRFRNSISVHDTRTGRHLFEFGRNGEGPGEFRNLGNVGWLSDTLYVTDWQLPRVTLFTAEGEFIRVEVRSFPYLQETQRGTLPIAYTRHGIIAQSFWLGSQEVAEGVVTKSPWVLVGPESRIIRRLAEYDLAGTRISAAVGDRVVLFARPMAERNLIALDGAGESLIAVTQPIADEVPGHFSVERRLLTGELYYRRFYRYEPRAVSESLADSLIERPVRLFSNMMPQARAMRAARAHYPIPAAHPPVSGIAVSHSGTVWLQREQTGAARQQWTVLDQDGNVVGGVVGPQGVTLLLVLEDEVWGTVKGEFDVPYIVRFLLVAADTSQ